jgi:hypothetical protein
MNQEQKNKIRELMFHRVPDASTRSRITQLASALADPDSDDWWMALYHYSLPEHDEDLRDDYNEFVTGFGPNLAEEGTDS